MSDEKMIMVGATENKPAVVHGMDGRFARVTPSLYLDGGVCVAFRTSTGEATVNAITFTAEEWDALYAAGNRALGRPEATKGRRFLVRGDEDEVRRRVTAAGGHASELLFRDLPGGRVAIGVSWGGKMDDPRSIEAAWLATLGVHFGRDGWEIES